MRSAGAAALLLSVGAAAAAAGAEFPISRDADVIIVPARVDGKDALFLVDTGAAVSVFDESLSSGAAVAQAVIQPAQGAAMVGRLYEPPEASVGELDLRRAGPVLRTDFAGLRSVLDRDVRGILGMSFLKDYVLEIDLDAGLVRLSPSSGKPDPSWGKPLPIKITETGVPAAAATIAGFGRELFELDTGDNGGGNLARPIFARLASARKTIKGKGLTYAGLASSPECRVERLSLNELRIPGLLFSPGRASSLGMGFFRRAAVILDFPRGLMYLRPGKNIDSPDEADMSGLHLLRREGRVVVLSIDEDSPADEAGIHEGDVIAETPDSPQAERDLLRLRRLLRSGDGKQVRLTLRRAGRSLPVTLKLKKTV